MKRIPAAAAALAVLVTTFVAAPSRPSPAGAAEPMSSGIRPGAGATVDGAARATRSPRGNGGAVNTLAGCPMFPPSHPYNQRVDGLPVAPNSAAVIANIQATGPGVLHADFGENPVYGQRLNVVDGSTPLVPVRYTTYPKESDPGPFPIPDNAEIQQQWDQHLYVLDASKCRIHEFWRAGRDAQGWYAANGATWDTTVWQPRPLRWTSAVAAGLPAIPAHASCEDVARGSINHVIAMAMNLVGPGFIAPASHSAPNTSAPNMPVYGMRFRLKADFDTSPYTGQAKMFLEAFKTYGLMVFDIGVNWHFGGFKGDCWNDAELNQLWSVPGTAFEVVDTGPVQQ